MAKTLPYNLHGWAFYKIVNFVLTKKGYQYITYHNFRHKSLVRPKSKSPNWQGSQRISYKANFSQRESMYLLDIKFNITYQNNQGEIQVRPLLRPLMSLNDTHFS